MEVIKKNPFYIKVKNFQKSKVLLLGTKRKAALSHVKNQSMFQLLMDKLPPTHKAKWFAGAALNSVDQAMASVLSTAMSRLNAFLDSEM